MGELKLDQKYSYAEYLAIDEASEIRYEFLHGEIVAMAGSSKKHNEISGNLFALLRLQAKRKGNQCKTFMSDVRLEIKAKDVYYYPDVLLSCSESDLANEKAVKEPFLIVEVLSESTANKDKSEKLIRYLQIPSLNYYLIIAQDSPEVYLYERIEENWMLRFFTELSQEIYLPKMDVTLLMTDIYEGLVFEEKQQEI